MIKPQTFIFFGTVGSGKGTQAEFLKKYLVDNGITTDIVYVSTGVEYRKLIGDGNYTGTMVKNSLEKGNLQPDFLTTSLFTSALVLGMKEDSFLITDGYPRTTSQSESFEMAMKFYGRDNIEIIYIELDKEEATKRMMLRGRTDDTEEGIAKRFDEYVKNVIPSMNYFKDKPGYTIHVIDGKQSKEEVHQDIIKSLNY